MIQYKSLSREDIVKHFEFFDKNSFEFNYIFNDCLPYMDKHNYWTKHYPLGLFDNGVLKSICFFIYNEYNTIKFVDIKRFMTISTERNKGYASQLFYEIVNQARVDRLHYIRLFSNPETVNFYKNHGVKFYGKCEHGYSFGLLYLLQWRHSVDINDEQEFINHELTSHNGVYMIH